MSAITSVMPRTKRPAKKRKFDDPQRSLSPETRPHKYASIPPVKVVVGYSQMPFFLPASHLRAQSPYFAARLKDCWDGQKGELWLQDVSPEDFGVIVDWMFESNFNKCFHGDIKNICGRVQRVNKLADELMMCELQNRLMDLLRWNFDRNKWVFTFQAVAEFREAQLAHTPLYHFALDMSVWEYMNDRNSHIGDIDDIQNLLKSPKALEDVFHLIKMYRQTPWVDPRRDTSSRYHIEAFDAKDER